MVYDECHVLPRMKETYNDFYPEMRTLKGP